MEKEDLFNDPLPAFPGKAEEYENKVKTVMRIKSELEKLAAEASQGTLEAATAASMIDTAAKEAEFVCNNRAMFGPGDIDDIRNSLNGIKSQIEHSLIAGTITNAAGFQVGKLLPILEKNIEMIGE